MQLRRLFRCALCLPLAFTLLPGCRSDTPVAREAKPGAPLTLTIAPRGEVKRGAVGEFTVTATALSESDDFSLDVDLPDELALYSGDLHRRGPVRQGTRFLLTFALRIPETGAHTITATSRLRVGETGSFTATAVYAIGEIPTPAPSAERGVAAEREGEGVREYRLP